MVQSDTGRLLDESCRLPESASLLGWRNAEQTAAKDPDKQAYEANRPLNEMLFWGLFLV